MIDNIKKGKNGENLAAAFLIKKGFTVRERNYRFKRSEIDIIASQSDLLIFVEVKTRSSTVFGYPEEAVAEKQEEKILEAADQYLMDIHWQNRVRYDIISIELTDKGSKITHFEDAFY